MRFYSYLDVNIFLMGKKFFLVPDILFIVLAEFYIRNTKFTFEKKTNKKAKKRKRIELISIKIGNGWEKLEILYEILTVSAHHMYCKCIHVHLNLKTSITRNCDDEEYRASAFVVMKLFSVLKVRSF